MRVLLTGYSAGDCDPERTGTLMSLLAYSLRTSGHTVVQGPPTLFSAESDRDAAGFDRVVVGLSSPVSPGAKHVYHALQLIRILSDSDSLVVLVDDPDVRKIGSGHRRAVNDPDSLYTPYLLDRRSSLPSKPARASILDGARMVSGLVSVGQQIPCIVPTFSWSRSVSGGITLPLGLSSDIKEVDPTALLMSSDYLLDCKLSMDRPSSAKARGTHWLLSTKTVSQSAKLWISGTTDSTQYPLVPAPDVRKNIVAGLNGCLSAMGMLEQPILASMNTTTAWWTPWMALSAMAGSVYCTDSDAMHGIGEVYTYPASHIEDMSEADREELAHAQKTALLDKSTDTAEDMVRAVLSRNSQHQTTNAT